MTAASAATRTTTTSKTGAWGDLCECGKPMDDLLHSDDKTRELVEAKDWENAELRATVEARDEALMRAGRDNLRLHGIVEACRPVVEWAKGAVVSIEGEWGIGLSWSELLAEVGEATSETRAATTIQRALGALDGAPDPRRVETAELANELAGLIQDTTDDFVPLNARYGLADAILAKFDITQREAR